MNSSSSPRCISKGASQPANFAEVFFRVAAMISNGGVDLMASGRDKGHQCAEAVALQGNLSGRLRQLNSGADRFHDISRACVAIIRRVKSQTVLPVGFGPYVEIDVRLLPPEQVRRDRDEPLGCQLIAGRSDVGVNAEQFLENDHCRCG